MFFFPSFSPSVFRPMGGLQRLDSVVVLSVVFDHHRRNLLGSKPRDFLERAYILLAFAWGKRF